MKNNWKSNKIFKRWIAIIGIIVMILIAIFITMSCLEHLVFGMIV